MQVAYDVRDAFLAWADRRFGKERRTGRRSAPADGGDLPEPEHRDAGVPTLAVADLRVAFGGNVAVDDASLSVGEREIVGLIGSNGAGKSTLMNAIGGFVAGLGLGAAGRRGDRRQGAGLSGRAGTRSDVPVGHPVPGADGDRDAAGGARGEERDGRALDGARPARGRRAGAGATGPTVGDLVELLGLGDYRDHYIADLSTGTRRVVELAGLLALDAKVLCLDEPTAGLAQRETEAFGPLIVTVQRQLDASVLLIEHDMPLIMGISDRVYCLEAGAVIAEGAPGGGPRQPRVIASYLGTDERAIARSGATPSDALDVARDAGTTNPPAVVERPVSVGMP